MQMIDKTKRNGSIDFLRCLLMFLIVLYHCCWYGPYSKDVRVVGVACWCSFAVDCFAFISGWYSIRFSVRKVLRFFYFACFATVAVFLIDPNHNVRFSMGWYGNSYLALMFFAPLLNAGLDSLYEKNGSRGLFFVWGLFTVVIMMAWLPLRVIGIDIMPPGYANSSVWTLVYMYVTGRVCSKTGAFQKFHKGMVLGLILLLEGVAIAWSFLVRDACPFWSGMKAWVYLSPITILLSVCYFMLFSRVVLPRWFDAVARFCAPSMFIVYLLHEATGGLVVRPYLVDAEKALADFGVAGAVVITAALLFVSCLTVDLMTRVR